MTWIPFSRASYTKHSIDYIEDALEEGEPSQGRFSQMCERWLQENLASPCVYLTPSGTSALEVALLALKLEPGEEVIVPSYTFTSTANAVLSAGGIPVFVDINPGSLCINPQRVREAITEMSRAVVPVHYAGVVADMEALASVAEEFNLTVIEDAAQALLSRSNGRFAGTLGDMGCLSFHYTKNISCGEGGAILINNPSLIDAVEVAREKGTDRSQFLRGEVDKYTWRSRGTSGLMAEPLAALLLGELLHAKASTKARQETFERYRAALYPLEQAGVLQLPPQSSHTRGNGHFLPVLVSSPEVRQDLLRALRSKGIQATTHYEPLHESPEGLRSGYSRGSLEVTEYVARRLVRLPTWVGIDPYVPRIVQAIFDFFGEGHKGALR